MKSLLAHWMPVDGSTHGAALDEMNALVHWLMALLFVGWALYFVYVLFRFRASKNPDASYEGTSSHVSTWIEGAVVLCEVILLVGFAIPAWARWVEPPAEDSNPFVVRVIGEQFAWNVHYPGADGVFGRTDPTLIQGGTNPVGLDHEDPSAADDVVAINNLHVPVNRQITIELSTKDVIHSFFLPTMRVKQDAIPGQVIPVHFTAATTSPQGCKIGTDCWEIACAQLCGLGHYRMRGFFYVDEPADLDAWLATQG